MARGPCTPSVADHEFDEIIWWQLLLSGNIHQTPNHHRLPYYAYTLLLEKYILRNIFWEINFEKYILNIHHTPNHHLHTDKQYSIFHIYIFIAMYIVSPDAKQRRLYCTPFSGSSQGWPAKKPDGAWHLLSQWKVVSLLVRRFQFKAFSISNSRE